MTKVLLDESLTALRTVVAGVTDGAAGAEGGWRRPTPCEAWNVTQVVQHATGDQIAWAAVVGGGAFPTEDPFAPSGELSTTPGALVEAAVARAEAAWATVDPDAAEVPTPLPTGPMPYALAAAACALDAAVHAWDIAVATGQESPLTPAMAAGLLPAARAIADPLRGFAFKAALDAQPGDDDVATLLRHLGRDPHWTP
jgi:uncharacterized protein (TIGR03086 family)